MRQHFEEERTRPLLLVSPTMKLYFANVPVGRLQRRTLCIFSQIKNLVQFARIIRFAHSLAAFQIPHTHFSSHCNKKFWIDFDSKEKPIYNAEFGFTPIFRKCVILTWEFRRLRTATMGVAPGPHQHFFAKNCWTEKNSFLCAILS